MIDLDHIHEILQAMRRNRLRTFLTACGIFWGIFMLVVMLGFGRGLEKAAEEDLGFYAINTRYFFGQQTSKPFAGRQVGRSINLTLDDLEAVNQVPGVQTAFGRSQRFGIPAFHKEKTYLVHVSGDYPEVRDTEASDLTHGRFLNAIDIHESRKVAVIGSYTRDLLFEPHVDPVGQTITIANLRFLVIGVMDASSAPAGRREYLNSRVFIPHPVFARLFGTRDRLGNILVLVDKKQPAGQVEDAITELLKARHKIAPNDERALRMFSRDKAFQRLMDLFGAIQMLSWVVGTLTLLAGAIGVSNIMMIAVAERSREIGIRKAVGATPLSIIIQIVTESTLLTALAGYLGLLAGVGALEISAKIMASLPTTGQGPSFFSSPELDLRRALFASLLLTVAGGLAGLAPARAAATIRPIEALAHE